MTTLGSCASDAAARHGERRWLKEGQSEPKQAAKKWFDTSEDNEEYVKALDLNEIVVRKPGDLVYSEVKARQVAKAEKARGRRKSRRWVRTFGAINSGLELDLDAEFRCDQKGEIPRVVEKGEFPKLRVSWGRVEVQGEEGKGPEPSALGPGRGNFPDIFFGHLWGDFRDKLGSGK